MSARWLVGLATCAVLVAWSCARDDGDSHHGIRLEAGAEASGSSGAAGAGVGGSGPAGGGHGGTLTGGNGGAAGGVSSDAQADVTVDTGRTCPADGERPYPTSYELGSYDGGVDGLCDPAEHMECDCFEYPNPWVHCLPDLSVCLPVAGTCGSSPCGWVMCPDGPPEGECAERASLTLSEDQSFWLPCTRDADCSPGNSCNRRIHDRMFCGRPGPWDAGGG